MTRYQIFHSTLAACVLLAAAGLVQAEIVQCTTEGGAITYTDAPCQIHAQTVHVSSPDKATGVVIGHGPATKDFAAAERARSVAWKIKRPATRHMLSDVAQLKMAKAATVSMDLERVALRQQALIEAAKNPPSSFVLWLFTSSASVD